MFPCNFLASYCNGDVESILTTSDTGDVLAGNVKGGSVSRSSNNYRQSTLDCDTTIKTNDLEGYLTLVVIHGHNAVVVFATNEDGVGGEWPLCVDPGRFCHLNTGSDLINLFAAENTVFTVVWVEGANTYSGIRDAEIGSIIDDVCQK